MTPFQWATLILGALGFAATWTIGVIGVTRAVESIKEYASNKIDAETEKINGRLSALIGKFEDDQKKQDHNFGEVGAAMRQYISNVEKEMHEIEIWGRDNFVLKDDFVKATDSLGKAIRDMAADIKSDFKDLNTKIDKNN